MSDDAPSNLVPPTSDAGRPQPSARAVLPISPGGGVVDYRLAAGPARILARPRLIGAMGVASIVIACFSFIGAGVSLVQSEAVKRVGRMFAAAALATTLPGGQPAASGGGSAISPTEQSEPNGWNLKERQNAIIGLTNMHALSVPRVAQLDRILAVAGRSAFDVAGEVTPAAVSRQVSQSGTRATATPGAPGADYFVTGSGKIELYDDRGVYFPSDHSSIVRVAASVDAYRAKQHAQPLTAANPGAINKPAQSGISPMVAQRQSATLLVIGEAGVSFLLAGLLLMAGIGAVRDASFSRRLHLIFAGLKLPFTALAIYGWMQLVAAYRPAAGTVISSRAQEVVDVVGYWAFGFAAVALIYPLVLLVVLSNRRVRAYQKRLV